MDEINELLYVLTKYKVRQVNVITNKEGGVLSENESSFRSFYQDITDGKLISTQDLEAWIGADASSKKFRRFLNDFKKRLYNTLLFIDVNLPLFTDSQRAYYMCWQQLAVLETLISRGLINNAFEMAKRLEKAAKKFEFTEIELRAVLFLRRYYALYKPLEKKFQQYCSRLKQLKQIRDAEIDVQEYFYHLQLINSTWKSKNQLISQKAKNFIERLMPLSEEVDTVFFQVPFWYIRVMERMSVHDWKETVVFCQKGIDFLDKKKHVSNQLYVGFLHQQAAAYLMLHEFENAKLVAEDSINKAVTGSRNWFKGKEILLSVLLHKGDYGTAWMLYKKTTRHKQFSPHGERFKEPWKVSHAYLALINALGLIQLSPREKGALKKFRLSRFLNDLPSFSKDKRGMNIPILIVQVLFLLNERKFDALEDRLEALRKYRSRHLSEEKEAFRTDCFIRMLHLMIKGDFERSKVEAKAAPLLKRMLSVPHNLANQAHEIEVIPYERQWSWVLKMLD
jgi:hypothetical protein